MARKKHAHHGGSWKVALADFMTAMFALFLVMWLVNLSPEQKEGISQYFKTVSIFKKTGSTAIIDMKNQGGKSEVNEGHNIHEKISESQIKEIEKNIKKTFKDSPDVIKNHLVFEKTPDGLRIDIIDSSGQSMFEVGSKALSPAGEDIVSKVAQELKNYSSPIEIEGHTDSLAYAGTGYTNWELSTERAISAKQSLVNAGISTDTIASISGYADTKPLVEDDKLNPKNRRISILIKK